MSSRSLLIAGAFAALFLAGVVVFLATVPRWDWVLPLAAWDFVASLVAGLALTVVSGYIGAQIALRDLRATERRAIARDAAAKFEEDAIEAKRIIWAKFKSLRDSDSFLLRGDPYAGLRFNDRRAPARILLEDRLEDFYRADITNLYTWTPRTHAAVVDFIDRCFSERLKYASEITNLRGTSREEVRREFSLWAMSARRVIGRWVFGEISLDEITRMAALKPAELRQELLRLMNADDWPKYQEIDWP